MSYWTVKWDPRAIKELKSLSSDIKERLYHFFEEKIHRSNNPRIIGEALTGDKAGLWRYRIGNYRAICKIYDKELLILMVKVNHRKEVYH